MNGYIYENQNTKAFYNLAWIGFGLSSAGMIAGLFLFTGDLAMKGFLGMSYLFSVVSCFTLAKVVRDKAEAERFIAKVEHAKTEQFLNENGKV